MSLFLALGETICCPCWNRAIPAGATNAYLRPDHGLFEVSIGGQHYGSVVHPGPC
ncbi:MAG: hypothetical protein AAGH78_18620 [Cyanobacteria bacterium P01_H01_bin.58]